jgi:helicase
MSTDSRGFPETWATARKKAELEDLLRSSLVYHQAQAADPNIARQLITLTRRYLDEIGGKQSGYLCLADGTGFSLQSVDYLYAQQRGEHQEFEHADFWSADALFGADLDSLTNKVGVLGRIPELTLGHRETGPFNPRVVAGVVRDWINGAAVDQIADRWFASAQPDSDERRRLAGHYLYSQLVGQVPWGMGAIRRLALRSEEDLRSVGHVPSLVFYGVRTREAAALRMAGVPRIAAEGLGAQWREGEHGAPRSFDGLRSWLKDLSIDQWKDALPADSPLDGAACRRVWSVLAGCPT